LKFFIKFLRLTGNLEKVFQKKLHNGLLFQTDPRDHIQKQILWYGFYEKKYVLAWEKMMEPGKIVIDIGANAGYYSLVASVKVHSGKVYAFEPNPVTYKMLLENIQLNNIKNIYPLQLAVSSGEEEKDLFISDIDNTGMTGLSKAENFSGKTALVKTVSLDYWVAQNKIGKIDFIKIDIEGGELLALQGMKNIVQFMRPGIFIECSDELLQRFGNNSQDMFSFFDDYEYHGFRIISANEIQKLNEPIEDELVLFLPKEKE
jgi:FkbM family methyltransferase